MNLDLLQKIKDWRRETAQKEGVELYIILQNKTIEAIAELLPRNEEEFKAIKGLGGKKFEKHGAEILSLVNNNKKEVLAEDVEGGDDESKKPYSVSNYLNFLNAKLISYKARIRGEVSSLDIRDSVLYFSIKDKDDESVLSCLMWKNNYDLCGISLKEGMEIIVEGSPNIYKPTGRLSFKVSTIELVGEGALKNAYDKLKSKLDSEGLFAVERKKAIPEFPQRIGLITSATGAVIHDFQSNLGKYGYKIKFVDSRVEGQIAIKDLTSAIDYLSDQKIDVIVIIRGGGSLESLQAFNNEVLVRKIAGSKVPVICGIGHDKDIPLASMVADRAVSTPTAVTTILNETWADAVRDIASIERDLMSQYQRMLEKAKYTLDDLSGKLGKSLAHIFRTFDEMKNKVKSALANIGYSIQSMRSLIDNYSSALLRGLRTSFEANHNYIDQADKQLRRDDPTRQLKLGYSIVSSGGKIIKSVKQVNISDEVNILVSDGKINSEVKNINNK